MNGKKKSAGIIVNQQIVEILSDLAGPDLDFLDAMVATRLSVLDELEGCSTRFDLEDLTGA